MIIKERVTQKTRCSHICDVCRRKIEKGSRMHTSFSSDGYGGVDYAKNCVECYDFIKAHEREIFEDDNFVTFETIREFMFDRGYLTREPINIHLKKRSEMRCPKQ